MQDAPSSRRRSIITGLATAAFGGVTGCLRLSESTTETEESQPTSASTDEPSPSSGGDPSTPTTSKPVDEEGVSFEEAWTISKWGSDVVTFDRLFYVSTWVSRQVYAVTPDGTIKWKTGKIGKYKKGSLAVTDSLVVGCGYGGQVTAFNRMTGEVQWDFTDAQYDAWRATPVVTADYVIAANNIDAPGEDGDYSIYILEKATGNVVERFDFHDVLSSIQSLTVVDNKLLISSFNFIDVYDLTSFEKVKRFTQGLFGSNYLYNGLLYAATDDNVYCYTLEGTELSQVWGASLRDSVYDLVITGDAIYANGNGGVFKVTLDGETEWWTQTDTGVGRITTVGDSIAVMDEYLQLYAINAESGEILTKQTLSPEGSLGPISSIGDVVLTTKDPITAYRLR